MKRLVFLARASTGHEIKAWEGYEAPLFDLSEEEDETSRQGATAPESKAQNALECT